MENPNTLSLIHDQTLQLDVLLRLSAKPPLFAPGEPLFWDDPHISKGMLALHLDPHTDLASRPPAVIDATVHWLRDYLRLKPGDAVLDLGCGPGLYAERLSRAGLRVVGIDASRRSIACARQRAADLDLRIEYHCQDYLTLDRAAEFDLALLIFGDLCPLKPEDRDNLLRRIHRALKSGGHFIFDVTTRRLRERAGLRNGWHVEETGFWKPGPHLVLEQGFDYPEHDAYLDQHLVIEANGRVSVYRNWFIDYSLETITPILKRQGFAVRGFWNDLAGTPYTPDTEWIGLDAEKAISGLYAG